MSTFEELKQRYMLSSSNGGSGTSGGPSVAVFTGCEVVPLVDGAGYFADLKTEVARLGGGTAAGEFIYIAGWWCGRDFSLDAANSGNSLADLLIQKARAGVDVRVLGWVIAPEVMQHPQVQASPLVSGILGLNGDTMSFIKRLQAEPALANKACLNILAHPAGACHLKMAVTGSSTRAVGFTGGLDLQQGRHTSNWRDVQTRVSGPAVQQFFESFRSMWNEVRGRPPVSLTAPSSQAAGSPPVTVTSHSSGMPDLPARAIASTSTRKMHVQGARTLPRFNFAVSGSIGGMPRNTPLSYAPAGLFEVRAVWEKALKAAQSYIYIEDQAFSSREIMDWVNGVLKAKPGLKVVLLTGLGDPSLSPTAIELKLFAHAINNHLCASLSAADRDRIGLFSHTTKTVHSKTSIVDDQWSIIGSSNAMRRSLFTDFEHSIAYMDEAGEAVLRYREQLWGTYFQASVPDMNSALGRWFAIPFRNSAAGAPQSGEIQRLRLPLTTNPLTADEQVLFDEIYDCDSRDTWGDDLMGLYMRRQGAGSFAP